MEFRKQWKRGKKEKIPNWKKHYFTRHSGKHYISCTLYSLREGLPLLNTLKVCRRRFWEPETVGIVQLLSFKMYFEHASLFSQALQWENCKWQELLVTRLKQGPCTVARRFNQAKQGLMWLLPWWMRWIFSKLNTSENFINTAILFPYEKKWKHYYAHRTSIFCSDLYQFLVLVSTLLAFRFKHYNVQIHYYCTSCYTWL